MSRRGRVRGVVTIVVGFGVGPGVGAMPTFTDGGLTVRENFDGVFPDVNGVTPLPDGWRTGTTTSSYGAGSFNTSRAAGITGAGALSANSTGAAYNFADGDSTTATDRATGFLAATNYVVPRNLFVQLINGTGQTLTGLNLSYDIEKYRTGRQALDFRLFVGTDGTNWSAPIADGSHTFPSDPTTAVVASVVGVNKSLTVDGLSVPSGGSVYVRWNYTSSGSVNSQALALDNFVATAVLGGPSVDPNDLVWDGDGSAGANPSDVPGTWSDGAATWYQKSSGNAVAMAAGQNATFGAGTGTGAGVVVTLDGAKAVGRIVFAANSTPFTLAAGSIAISGSDGAGLRAEQSAAITSDVSFVGTQQVTVVHGGDVLTLSGSVTGAAVTVGGNGTLAATGHVRVNALTVSAGSRVDVGRSVIVDYGAGDADPYGVLLAGVRASYDHGQWTNAGALACSAAAADGTRITTLAVVDNAGANPIGNVDGDAVDGSSVLLKYTYYGDADLSGAVTKADLDRMVAGISAGLSGWQNGDFNLDGQINADDVTLYSMGAAGQGAPLGPTVPEPGVAGALAAIALRGRRRKAVWPRGVR